MKQKKKKEDRVRGLDGIRTVALLGVLLYHTFPKQIPGGFLGVVLFFTVTGYLAALSGMSAVKKGSFHVGNYYVRRIKRLYPELIVVMLCTIGVMTFAAPYKMSTTQSEFLSVMLGYNNFWQIRMNANYFARLADNSPFTHLWYIAILLQFEVLWPWLLKGYCALKKKKGTGFALGIFLALTAAVFLVMPVMFLIKGTEGITEIYYSTFTRIFSVFAGVCTGLMHAEGIRFCPGLIRRKPLAALALLMDLSVIIVLYFLADGTYAWVYLFAMEGVTLLSCRMIDIVSIRKNGTGRYMDNIFCRALSRYSYEIYLWQYPVLMIASLLGFGSAWWHYLLQIAVIAGLSVWLYMFNANLQKRIG